MATERYYPRTQKEIFDKLIQRKRLEVSAGRLQWTDESPSDPGIGLLSLVAYEGADIEAFIDNRIKQAYLVNACTPEAVHDGARGLGYQRRSPVPATLLVVAKSKKSTFIPATSQFAKDLDDGTTLVYEVSNDVTFTGEETKKFYVTQGETRIKSQVAAGTAFEKIYLTDTNIDYHSITVMINGVLWSRVFDFANSVATSRHYIIEFDYRGYPIIIFGDGVFGLRPPKRAQIIVGYRVCAGSLGNVPPGVMRTITPIANLDYIRNESPTTGELLNDVLNTDSSIELVADGAINGFADAGVAYIGDDAFSYNGKDGNVFINVTGLKLNHPKGSRVSYSMIQVTGEDAESLTNTKLSALRENRIKTTALSLLDYAYLARKIPGVARASAFRFAHTIFVQVVPTHGDVPPQDLLDSVSNYLTTRTSARHIVHVVPPKYVYIDITVRVSPMPGLDFSADVAPRVLDTIRGFLSPLTTDATGTYYSSDWGQLVKKFGLFYLLAGKLGGHYIANTYIDVFKRSTDAEGNNDVLLNSDELPNVGTITVLNTDDPTLNGDICTNIGF